MWTNVENLESGPHADSCVDIPKVESTDWVRNPNPARKVHIALTGHQSTWSYLCMSGHVRACPGMSGLALTQVPPFGPCMHEYRATPSTPPTTQMSRIPFPIEWCRSCHPRVTQGSIHIEIIHRCPGVRACPGYLNYFFRKKDFYKKKRV